MSYPIKYHIKDHKHPSVLIKEIEAKEYELIKEFSQQFIYYEGIFFAYLNYFKANNEFSTFKHSVETGSSKKYLQDVQTSSIYPITTLVVLTRMFIDNAKSYSKELNSSTLQAAINKIEDLESIKTIKAIRNFAIHSSIPVKGSKGIFNLLKETQSYEFNVDRETILKGANKWDRIHLEKLNSNVITFEPLFDNIKEEMFSLFTLILEEFKNTISEEQMIFLKKNIYTYVVEDGTEFFPSIFVKSENLGEGMGYITKEGIPLNSEVLKELSGYLIDYD